MKFGTLAGLVGLVVLIWLLWTLRQVLLLLFAAVVFATVINKLVQQLQKIRIPRQLALPIVLGAIAATTAIIFRFIVPAIAAQIPEYTFFSEQGLNRIQDWYQYYRAYLPGDILKETSLAELFSSVSAISPGLVDRAVRLFSLSLDFFVNFLLTIVVTIMILSDPASYRQMLIRAFPKFYRQRADEITTACEQALNGWALGLLFNITIITLASGIGLTLIGIPLPAVNALLAGCMTFIPNVGPLLSVVPPTLMALSIGPWKAAGVLGLYLAIQQLEGNILTPMVMKQQVSLLPALSLMAQVIFAVWFGFLGLFLALPLVIVSQTWIKELLVKDILDRWSVPRKKRKLNSTALRHKHADSKMLR